MLLAQLCVDTLDLGHPCLKGRDPLIYPADLLGEYSESSDDIVAEQSRVSPNEIATLLEQPQQRRALAGDAG